jgi:hypothetical protein
MKDAVQYLAKPHLCTIYHTAADILLMEQDIEKRARTDGSARSRGALRFAFFVHAVANDPVLKSLTISPTFFNAILKRTEL